MHIVHPVLVVSKVFLISQEIGIDTIVIQLRSILDMTIIR